MLRIRRSVDDTPIQTEFDANNEDSHHDLQYGSLGEKVNEANTPLN